MDVLDQVVGLIEAARFAEAEALLRQALAAAPNRWELVYYLGIVAQRLRRPQESVHRLRQALSAQPNRPEIHYHLGVAFRRLGQFDQAIQCFRRTIELRPDFLDAHVDTGAVLMGMGHVSAAKAACAAALRLDPGNIPARMNLGYIARKQGQLDEAIGWFRDAASRTNNPMTLMQLGSALRESGQIEQAVDCFRASVALNPDLREAHSNLVYALHYDPRQTPQDVFEEHVRWGRRHADPLSAGARPHENDRTPERRLRIGYSAATFNSHVTGFCLEPVLRNHDRDRFEIVCYGDVTQPDAATERFRGYADLWRDTRGMNDEQWTSGVRQDRIDILIDLTLHMRHNRLAAFARRPAPVQVTYLAYPATSGMSAMGWAISDIHLDPPGAAESFYTEQLIRLPHSYWCYHPAEPTPDVGPLPSAQTGRITFGSLNSFAKVNGAVIKLWARVLAAVPGSRLAVLIAGGAACSPSAVERFAQVGIPPEQLLVFDLRPRAEYLKLYHQIDIALDPFPYGGHTTSLDALWMGVPVVSLAGRTAVGRAGVTMLTNLKMTELLASTPDDYMRIAADLAADTARLASIRSSLRQRMLHSPLTDSVRYTNNLEDVYRAMWRQWCDAPAPAAPEAGKSG